MKGLCDETHDSEDEAAKAGSGKVCWVNTAKSHLLLSDDRLIKLSVPTNGLETKTTVSSVLASMSSVTLALTLSNADLKTANKAASVSILVSTAAATPDEVNASNASKRAEKKAADKKTADKKAADKKAADDAAGEENASFIHAIALALFM